MKNDLEQQINQTVQDLFGVDSKIELTRPDEQFGDFATNVALQLSKQLGKNPREISEALAAQLREALAEQVSEISVAGPGFINLKLTDQALLMAVNAKPNQSLAGQVVVAEYSDPNPFKVLHAGHLYTTIVGNAIGDLLEVAGGTVHRVNFGGDVGLHVGKAMWGIVRQAGGEALDEAAARQFVLNDVAVLPLSDRAAFMADQYVAGNNAYEDDETAKEQIVDFNQRVYTLYEGDDHDSDFAQIYRTCRAWSYEYFNLFYEQIGVAPFEKYYPESETTPVGVATVKEQLAKGVYEESDGAVVFKGEPYGLHTRVFLNSRGLPTYEGKEVGLIMKKWADYHFDKSFIITGNDILGYMQVVQKSIEQFEPELVARSEHRTHGQVKLEGGVKMSSRKGNVLYANDILDAAVQAAQQLNEQATTETAYAAVKYAFLKQRLGGDIIYSPAESVALEGNSGPYLQYAHARARSILAKAEAPGELMGGLETGERSLVRKLTEYSEVVDKAVAELAPHLICTYLYELAQNFNRFYEHNRVIDDPRQATRSALVAQYAETLRSGLSLLGIASPDKM
jgi:arginyl-tRNA synthetase